MSDPVGSFSFYDLILRVSTAAGISYYGTTGQRRALIPVHNEYSFDLCKRICNDGIKMFIAAAPYPGGWRWMRRLYELTFSSCETTSEAKYANSTKITDTTLLDTYDESDDLNGYWIYITVGTGKGSYAQITDYEVRDGSITAFADYSGTVAGTVKATSVAHDMATGDVVTITGTTSYNGTFAITKIDADSFYFTDTWVADDATGTWEQCQIEVAKWLTLDGVTGGTTPVAGDTYSITSVQTIEGDKARYPLPDDFGRPVGKITYLKDSSRSFAGWADEGQLRKNKEVSESDSYPVYASARAYRKRKWEIVFDPSPSAGDTVVISYEVGFSDLELDGGLATATDATYLTNSSIANLYPDDYFNDWTIYIIDYTGTGSYAVVTAYTGNVGTFTVAEWLAVDGVTTGVTPAINSAYYVEESTAKHPAGWQFDNAVLSACLAQAQLQIENMKGDYLNKFVNLDLAAAQLQDLRSAPLSLLNTSGDREEYERRKLVTYS